MLRFETRSFERATFKLFFALLFLHTYSLNNKMASRQPVHSVLFDNNQDQSQYYGQPPAAAPAGAAAGGDGLQFYSSNYGDQYSANANNYYSSPPTGDMHTPNYNYTAGSSGSFWSAFGTGGFADEPPLLEELGLNFGHIKTKVSSCFREGIFGIHR